LNWAAAVALVNIIHAGDFGIVYCAEIQTSTQNEKKTVAVKTIKGKTSTRNQPGTCILLCYNVINNEYYYRES
jgi:hypothetical protein